jgi:pimeloyl-ACP methyl ester carboxylesterase
MRLLPLRLLSTLVVVGAVLLLGAMWYYTNQLNEGAFIPDNTPPGNNVRILQIENGSIILAPLGENDMWQRDGVFGLEFEGGYAQAGRILDRHPDQVRRQLGLLDGEPRVNTEARLDSFAYRGDPMSALGLRFQDVSIEGAAGNGPAWFLPGEGETWAVFVHGKGASREEALRTLPVLSELALPSLVITYRNDPDYSDIEDGRYAYGITEWRDVAAAIDYAREAGARRFVLIGHSMGGAIVLALLLQPEYAALVDRAVLDSPVTDLRRTVKFRAGVRDLQPLFTSAAMRFATWRNGIDWDAMDYLRRANELQTPILLFHGDADRTVPVSTSDRLAAERPDLVTYRRLPGVEHVQGWNADPEGYAEQVRRFLTGSSVAQ